MKKIAIFGAGGFGREVHMLIQQINATKKTWEFIGYFDDGVKIGTLVNDYPVLGGMAELNKWSDNIHIVYAIGDPSTKRKIVENVKNSFIHYPILIHPNVLIGDMQFNSIGEGSIICAGNIITVNINIGKHVIMNLSCTTGHDTKIGDYCSFMPTVNISGEVIIEDAVYVGTGAKIINQLTIGENTIIGSGAVVAKTLPANCTAVGIPAKPIKFHE
jgi:sugar O-acyltransferase (sialic acid O-acetyltransferase NeuD family)